MKIPPKNTDLSIIILSFNVSELLIKCLDSIYKYNLANLERGNWEILVADNGSPDNTLEVLKAKKYSGLRVIENKENLGFSAGNNVAARVALGEYVLFLNPDTVVDEGAIDYCLTYLKANSEVGAGTVEVFLGNGKLDMTAHRGFPTPWNSFCFFSGLSRLFPHSKLFSGYTLGNLDLKMEHEVDSINGAFFMMPKVVGQKLNWFDEDFYWKGEDLDLCYRIKELGLKIVYLPNKRIHHYKGSSKGHRWGSKTLEARFKVMRLFYEKHYQHKYPWIVKELVYLGISWREFLAGLGI